MKRFIWVTAILPILLSFAILILMVNGVFKNPVFQFRVDESVLVLLVGFLLSGILGLHFLSQSWLRLMHRQNISRAREETAAEHRRFLNRLDHELKNPLTAIRAGVANLGGTDDGAARRKIMDSIDMQVKRLSHLVADLRKVAEIGMRPLERYSIDLADLLHELYLIAQEHPQLGDRRVTLNLPFAPLPPVCGDRDLLLLALHNVIGNAIKFTRNSDAIEIRGRMNDDHVCIGVNDSGPGIPMTEQAHVWEELYRGEAAQGIPGSGIGLSLVQAIVERHGGTVRLHSQPGKGTSVELELPLTAAAC